MLHAPRRGMWWSRPKVHSGFDKAWRNNGLNRRVLCRLKRIFDEGDVDKLKCRILVTGTAVFTSMLLGCHAPALLIDLSRLSCSLVTARSC